MASRTPRGGRRRRQSDQTFPVVPIAIGVVLVGFAIGAAIPALRHPRDGGAVALATPRPAPATQSPPAEPSPTSEPTPAPTKAPKAPKVAPTPHPVPTRTATPAPTASPPPTPVPPSSAPKPTTEPTSSPEPVATPAVRPAPATTARPVRTPAPAPQPTPTARAELQSPIARDGARVVRAYLAALMEGNDAGASALLAADPGTPDAQLSEKEFLDKSARIVDVSGQTLSPTSAIIQADIQSAKGAYFARYTVERTASGSVVIRQHDYIKP